MAHAADTPPEPEGSAAGQTRDNGRDPILRRLRQARALLRLLARGVDHEDVIHRVTDSGALQGRYLLLTAMSAGIAALGLMQNSPAVIIGAMLVSPMMGPIVLLGFSFRMLSWGLARQSLMSLAAGFGLAFLVALVLTVVSPIKEATSEILARTRPTLFDLAVAVFSGVAGAYAVIKGRGETIVGVAIATALMPPVATIAFGVGVGDWRIALGAGLLFATNLVAIALAAAGMAALYGFKRITFSSKGGRWRTLATLLVIFLLSIPLSVSLQRISWETRVTANAREALATVFGEGARITSLATAWTQEGGRVDAVVLTRIYQPDARQRLTDLLSGVSQRPVEVRVDQITTAEGQTAGPSLPAQPDRNVALYQEINAAVPFAVEGVAFDIERRLAMVALRPEARLDLEGAQALEQGLAQRFPDITVRVSPPLQPIAPITLVRGADGRIAGAGLEAALWALARWRATTAQGTVCIPPRGLLERAAVEQAITQRPDGVPVTLALSPAEECETLSENEARVVLQPR